MAKTTLNPNKITTITKKVTVKKPIIKLEKRYPFYYAENDDRRYASLNSLIATEYMQRMSICSDTYYLTKQISEKENVDFSYEVSSSVYTCGFLELGELYVNSDISVKKNLTHLAELLDGIIPFTEGYTLFMNTNGKGSSEILEKALPLTKHWVKVKTYENPGSGNTLTLWVTNN